MEFTRFPHIGHLSDFIATMKKYHPECGVVELVSSNKIHGTSVSIVAAKNKLGDWIFQYQSRNNIINLKSDMMGSVTFLEARRAIVCGLLDRIVVRWTTLTGRLLSEDDRIHLVMEWCGNGIQKNVAIAELPRFMAILAINIDGRWVDNNDYKDIYSPADRIFHISQAGEHRLTMDLNSPEVCRQQISEMVDEVEICCPFAKLFGISGIGEGLVFKALPYLHSTQYWFKAKGELHSESKVKTIKPLTEEQLNSLADSKTFAKAVVTPRRLEQGIEFLKEKNYDTKSAKSLGTFLKWIIQDVKDESKLEIAETKVDQSQMTREVSQLAKGWFLQQLDHTLP